MSSSIEVDRFSPILYKTLSVPSYVHGYSLGIEYMRNWFLSKFKEDYFKTVHIYGKYILDDYTRYDIGEYVKREKPAVVITPTVDFDFNRDGIDMYLYGAETFARRTKAHNAFLKDYDKKLFLSMGLRVLRMNFLFRIRVSTRAEQLDLFQKIELAFRIGATHGEDVDMDFHVPYDIMVNLAYQAGFEVDEKTNQIKKPRAFIKYLNTHSEIPFLYKLRKINQNYEFFIRMSNMYCHINTVDKLSLDDGEQEGQLHNNFTIEMAAVLDIPIPQYYVLFTREELKYEVLKTKKEDYGLYYIKQTDIPEVNEKGWDVYVTTQYLTNDPREVINEISIEGLFDEDPIEEIIKDSMSLEISPTSFIDIAVYTNDINKRDKIKTYVNWKENKIEIQEDIINSLLYLAIYVDKLYINEHRMMLDDMNYKDRLSSSKKSE